MGVENEEEERQEHLEDGNPKPNRRRTRSYKLTGGLTSYRVGNKTLWSVDVLLKLPDGTVQRFRQRKIPTKEQALMLAAKKRAEAFEGRHFEKTKPVTLTVRDAWEKYEPITRRDNDSWRSDLGRARHVLRHLGQKKLTSLSQGVVDAYRTQRLQESTRFKRVPSFAQLNREVALLKRMVSYQVECKALPANPLARVAMLREDNVRKVLIDEERLSQLLDAADSGFKPVLLIAYEHGFRRGEVLSMRWSQVDLREGTVRLLPQDTKTNEGRQVYLTRRSLEALKAMPRRLGSDFVFINPATGERWDGTSIRRHFLKACQAIGIDVTDGEQRLWFHDTRRSGVTNARKRGVPESVCMRISGHRTTKVFQRYNIVDGSDLKEAARRIEAGRLQEAGKRWQEDVKVVDGAPTPHGGSTGNHS